MLFEKIIIPFLFENIGYINAIVLLGVCIRMYLNNQRSQVASTSTKILTENKSVSSTVATQKVSRKVSGNSQKVSGNSQKVSGNNQKVSGNSREEEEDGDMKPALGTIDFVPFRREPCTEAEMINRSKQFYEEVNSRRTLRFFSDKPVPRSVIDNLVRSAGTAPSGAHTEPWTYVVVADMETKSRIRDIIENEEMLNYTQRMGNKWTTDLAPLKTDWNKPYLTSAPYLVLLFKQTQGYMPNGEVKVHYYNEISCCISAGIFITAVNQAGLVTLTSTPLNCGSALRSLLNRPDNEKLLMLLPVGYAADDAVVPDIKRKNLDEIMVYI